MTPRERQQKWYYEEGGRKWMLDRIAVRRAFMQRWKVAAGCFDCGYNENPVALDFDHLRDKKFPPSNGSSRSWKTLVAELKKCVVRCANCHRIKTHD